MTPNDDDDDDMMMVVNDDNDDIVMVMTNIVYITIMIDILNVITFKYSTYLQPIILNNFSCMVYLPPLQTDKNQRAKNALKSSAWNGIQAIVDLALTI